MNGGLRCANPPYELVSYETISVEWLPLGAQIIQDIPRVGMTELRLPFRAPFGHANKLLEGLFIGVDGK
jgi:hypothetical protein